MARQGNPPDVARGPKSGCGRAGLLGFARAPEIIFDQGLGDLFTVRTAGQLIDSAVIASLEYAVKKLHVSLICVLGHEHCGAIEAPSRSWDD